MIFPKRIQPTQGQESVWDYPRPPRVERVSKRIVIEIAGVTLADTTGAYRVLETSHPPVYYLPQSDIRMEYLQRTPRTSFCEFKGSATYWAVAVGDRIEPNAAWGYLDPAPGFEPIAGYIAFYAGRMDRCTVDGETVEAQPGDFYGGWITSDVVGPFKGGAGTWGW
ncbi:MAG: DUF427 domain-containing protein [Chloroflexi bacterium]|nr:DUF427 domain-containing protein [Chloroflexota bacterium]